MTSRSSTGVTPTTTACYKIPIFNPNWKLDQGNRGQNAGGHYTYTLSPNTLLEATVAYSRFRQNEAVATAFQNDIPNQLLKIQGMATISDSWRARLDRQRVHQFGRSSLRAETLALGIDQWRSVPAGPRRQCKWSLAQPARGQQVAELFDVNAFRLNAPPDPVNGPFRFGTESRHVVIGIAQPCAKLGTHFGIISVTSVDPRDSQMPPAKSSSLD